SRVARDNATLNGNVEVFADQHTLIAQIEIGHSEDGHGKLQLKATRLWTLGSGRVDGPRQLDSWSAPRVQCPAARRASARFRPRDRGIEHPIREPPLVVVPRADLDEGTVDDFGHRRVVDRRSWIVVEID